mmetsp:Transcript_10196/g.29083  ORF Transcript_10196/g.29083 Transcript_10196/m.29083 type:complete len:100 (-) Transcript_10196:703-1002(-)
MTIQHDGVDHEEVDLSVYRQRTNIYRLFREKGFVKKSPDVIAKQRRELDVEREIKAAKSTNMSVGILKMYGGLVVLAAFIMFCCSPMTRRRKRGFMMSG